MTTPLAPDHLRRNRRGRRWRRALVAGAATASLGVTAAAGVFAADPAVTSASSGATSTGSSSTGPTLAPGTAGSAHATSSGS